MVIQRLGDMAYLLRDLAPLDPARLALRLRRSSLNGLEDAVAAYETVGIYVEPDAFDIQNLKNWINEYSEDTDDSDYRLIEIPVCYEMGLDMEHVCSVLKLDQDEVIALHADPIYRSFAIGFSPGFAYLGYLDERLAGLDRMPQPRTKVPAGSVAIVGKQTAVYPQETPGGWWIIGRTPCQMVNLSEGYFPIEAGDQVHFVPISSAEFEQMAGQKL